MSFAYLVLKRRKIKMFLFWIFIALVIGAAEEIHDSIDAYNYHKSGGFYAKYPELRPKDYNNKK